MNSYEFLRIHTKATEFVGLCRNPWEWSSWRCFISVSAVQGQGGPSGRGISGADLSSSQRCPGTPHYFLGAA